MFFDSPPSSDTVSPSATKNYRNPLSPDQFLQRFHELLLQKPLNENKIIKFLEKTPDVLMLIRLSLKDKVLARWCEDERISFLWDEIWRRADRNPTFVEAEKDNSLVYRGLRPQQNISSYRLVCGLTLFSDAQYLVEQRYAANSEIVLSLLIQASEFGSYDALNTLTNININKLANNIFEFPEIILAPLLRAAPWHGTPIYLLCAISHYYIANYYNQQNKLLESESSYQCALTYLYAADFCESASADAIYNAYNLQGIKASNVWGIGEISQLIEKLIEESNLDSTARSRARTTANNIVQNFLSLQQKNATIKNEM